MKLLPLLAVLLISACATAPLAAPVTPPAALQPSDLNGTWDVSLLYSKTEPPSATVMVLKVEEDGALTGSFYDSEFLEANYSVRGDVLAFGTVTTDGTAPYAHSGRLVDGKIEGQTLSFGRDFLMIWVATRRDEAPPPAG